MWYIFIYMIYIYMICIYISYMYIYIKYISHIYIIYGIYNIRCIYIYISPVKIHVIDGCVNKERLQQDSANQQGGGVLAIPPFKATVQWVMEGVEIWYFLAKLVSECIPSILVVCLSCYTYWTMTKIIGVWMFLLKLIPKLSGWSDLSFTIVNESCPQKNGQPKIVNFKMKTKYASNRWGIVPQIDQSCHCPLLLLPLSVVQKLHRTLNSNGPQRLQISLPGISRFPLLIGTVLLFGIFAMLSFWIFLDVHPPLLINLTFPWTYHLGALVG